MVTTPTEDGLLSVGNSAYSHKSKILMGAAVPTLVGVGIFTVGKQVDRAIELNQAFEDFETAVEEPREDERTDQEKIQAADALINRLGEDLE
jgi:hypothetical protein